MAGECYLAEDIFSLIHNCCMKKIANVYLTVTFCCLENVVKYNRKIVESMLYYR